MLEKNRKDKTLGLCSLLVQKTSYSGEENKAAEVLKAYMLSEGFDEVMTDDYGNVIGKICGNRPGKRLLFDGHIDTVPVLNEKDWKHNPFEPEIENGRLYGRGTTDMKGAVAAFVSAAGYFKEDYGKDFPGEIYVAGVVQEECFEGVAARSISNIVKPDYVIIGEASGLNLKIGQRGRAEIVVETYGISAHSANPEKGSNAVYHMCEVIQALQKLALNKHPKLGGGIMELTDIRSEPYPGASVIPAYCRATYDRRLLVGETRESVIEPLKILLKTLEAEDKSLKAKVSYAFGKEVCYTGKVIESERFFPGWLFDEDEPFIKDVEAQLKQKGFEPEITFYNFCTNGSHYAGEAGIKTLGFGPSYENIAHTVDEYIELEQLEKAAEGYYAIMEALLK